MSADADLLSTMGIDAAQWAREYVRLNPTADEGAMITWFANALEAGRAAGRKETCPHTFPDLFISDDLIICAVCGTLLADGSPGATDAIASVRRIRTDPQTAGRVEAAAVSWAQGRTIIGARFWDGFGYYVLAALWHPIDYPAPAPAPEAKS